MADEPLFVRLYLDEDVHPDLAQEVQKAGFDCEAAIEAGMRTKGDEEQLEYAARQGRCILTFNIGDFHALATQWAKACKTHSGILLTKQVSRQGLGTLLKQVLQFLNTTSADEMHNVVRFL
jgi:predicted nuclease of predicted toxin-antitoxin system